MTPMPQKRGQMTIRTKMNLLVLINALVRGLAKQDWNLSNTTREFIHWSEKFHIMN